MNNQVVAIFQILVGILLIIGGISIVAELMTNKGIIILTGATVSIVTVGILIDYVRHGD